MQRLTIRLIIAIFTFILGVVATFFWFSFRRPLGNETKLSTNPVPVSQVADDSPTPEATLAITEPVEFFGWWWDEQVSNRFNKPDTPTIYLKLEEWVSGVSGDAPEPDYIDIIYHLRNKETKTETFVVSAVGDFKWAKPDLGVYGGSEKDPEELLIRVLWKDKRTIGQQIVRDVAPGEIRGVKFENFNLRAVTDKYLSKDHTRLDLWPWKFRASITVRTLEGALVDKEQGILSVIPGD